MKLVHIPLVILLASTLTACGSSKDGSSNTAGNYKSGDCGSTVVSDYNTMVIRCKYMSTASDATNCRSTAQSFIAKYPGINCRALSTSSSSVDGTEMQITETKIKTVIDSLSGMGY